MRVIYSGCLTILLLVGGCAATKATRTQLVIDRAVFDLQCDAGQLNVAPLGGDAYGVTGCGQRAAYVLVGGAQAGCRETLAPWYVRKYCTAVLNSEDGSAARTEPPPG